MRPVRREELTDYVTWTERRAQEQPLVLEAKRRRRVHVGDCLTLLFENRASVRWQVQEMMRVERIVKEADVLHELATYNELLGGEGELGATLLVEIDDSEERARKLASWLDLPGRVYVELEDGTKVFATFDPRQKGDDRVSAVQFLKFRTGGRVPVAVGVDLTSFQVRALLTGEQQTALGEDLADR